MLRGVGVYIFFMLTLSCLADEIDDLRKQAWDQMRNGQIYEATITYLNALELAESSKDHNRTGIILNNIADINVRVRDYDKARDYLRHAIRALKISEEDNQNYIAISYFNMAKSYRLGGDYDSAHRHINAAMDYCQKHGIDGRNNHNINQKGLIYLNEGDYSNAIKLFKQVLHTPYHGIALSNLGESHYELKNLDSASYYFEASIEYKEMRGQNTVTPLANLASILIEMGDQPKAKVTMEKFINAAEPGRDFRESFDDFAQIAKQFEVHPELSQNLLLPYFNKMAPAMEEAMHVSDMLNYYTYRLAEQELEITKLHSKTSKQQFRMITGALILSLFSLFCIFLWGYSQWKAKERKVVLDEVRQVIQNIKEN